VIEALATRRCFRPMNTSGNSAAIAADEFKTARKARKESASMAKGQYGVREMVLPRSVLSASVPFQLPVFPPFSGGDVQEYKAGTPLHKTLGWYQ